MATTRKVRGWAMAILCATLAAAPAQAAATRSPALGLGQELVLAARVWLGGLLGSGALAPSGAAAGLRAVSGNDEQPSAVGILPTTSPLDDQHVDNPGQTAMKDGV
jgi:hypothetical protein